MICATLLHNTHFTLNIVLCGCIQSVCINLEPQAPLTGNKRICPKTDISKSRSPATDVEGHPQPGPRESIASREATRLKPQETIATRAERLTPPVETYWGRFAPLLTPPVLPLAGSGDLLCPVTGIVCLYDL